MAVNPVKKISTFRLGMAKGAAWARSQVLAESARRFCRYGPPRRAMPLVADLAARRAIEGSKYDGD